nr:calcium-binding protein [Aquabacterium terrae]
MDGTVWTYDDVASRVSTAASEGPDELLGTAGPDVIDALGGDDLVRGGAGNDTLSGSAGNDRLFGDGDDDVVDGGAGNDELRDGPGADVVRGGIGDDTIYVEGGGDTVDAGPGNDVVNATSDPELILLSPGWGQDAYFWLVGGDTLRFGTGIAPTDLTLWTVGPNLRIEHSATASTATLDGFHGGWDPTGLKFEFADATVWNLAAIQSAIAGVLGTEGDDVLQASANGGLVRGLAGNDTLNGSAAADTLDGGSGNDRMTGGAGNDAYVIDATADQAIEGSSAGTDTVRSSNGTGNALDNTITGNGGANVLDGGTGNDVLSGGTGNDSYVVDASGDSIIEAAGGGVDLVTTSLGWTLGAELENLTLTGTAAVNGTGNGLANKLTGNAGDNVLNGGAGNDTMIGGAGNDTYIVDISADVVTEAASAGNDTIESSVTLTLATNVENLTLTGSAPLNGTGNTLNNVLRGNAGANTLNGGTGADAMTGGTGDDIYVVDNAADTTVEVADEGIDLVQSAITWTLANHVERLTLTGTSVINGTGNALDNMLTGNSGNNTLNGGSGNDMLDGAAGNDTMLGGTGDDTFVVNVATDVVTENADEGIDVVLSAVAWTLGNHLENLTLIGSSLVNGTGNALNNTLLGNVAANVLSGGAGNDTLDGAAGNDTLAGGTGADTYAFQRGNQVDTVQENDATAGIVDSVLFGANIATSDIAFSRVGNDLQATINGTTDTLLIKDWYLGSAHRVEQFKFADGTVLSDVQVQPAGAGAVGLVGILAWDSAGSGAGGLF